MEERGKHPRGPGDLQAVRPLPATPRHTPPEPLTCLGDKRSPVQIRAPRLREKRVSAPSAHLAVPVTCLLRQAPALLGVSYCGEEDVCPDSLSE
jgi:hypothetical protein